MRVPAASGPTRSADVHSSTRVRLRRHLVLPPIKFRADCSREDSASLLFDQLAAEHCRVARVSLGRFPPGGLGWVLRRPDATPHADRPSATHESTSQPRLSAGVQEGQQTAEGLIGCSSDTGRASTGGPLTLLSVPLRLCLSHELPECCPPALRSAALRDLWYGSGSDQSWELHLAAALLWACHPPRRAGAAAVAADITEVAVDAAATAATPVFHAHAEGDAFARDGVLHGCVEEGGGGGTDGTGGDGCEGVFTAFWRRYRSLLPALGDLATLLFFNEEELGELQDPPLAAEARAWQQAVRNSYDRWIAAAAFRAEVGEVTLEEWLWAVGCVESRAFGFRAASDGRELHVYVPFFCLANFQPGAPTLHVLRLDPDPKPDPDPGLDPCPRSDPDPGPDSRKASACCATASGSDAQPPNSCCGNSSGNSCPEGAGRNGRGGSSQEPGSRQVGGAAYVWEPTADMLVLREGDLSGHHHHHHHPPPTQGSSERHQGSEQQRPGGRGLQGEGHVRGRVEQDRRGQLYIDYGKKDNRSLLYQYGFVLHGNSYDRLDWGGTRLDSSCRMRRDWVYDMAEQLSSEAQTSLIGGASSPGLDPRLEYGGIEAVRRRFRSAAASIVESCGWRNLRERHLVSQESEERALGGLTQWVAAQLRGFSTAAEQDAQLLRGYQAERGAASAVGGGWDSGETYAAAASAAVEADGAGSGAGGSVPLAGGALREQATAATSGVEGGGGDAGCVGGLGTPALLARLQVAVEYRLERKLLLLASLELLRRLKEKGWPA